MPGQSALLNPHAIADFSHCRRSDPRHFDQAVHGREGPVPIAKCHDLARHEGADEWQPLELSRGGPVQVERLGRRSPWTGLPGLSWRGAEPPPRGEAHLPRDGSQQARPNAGDTVERLEVSEGPVGRAVGYDGPSQGESDARQPGDLRRRGPVQVHPLARTKRAGERDARVPMGSGRSGDATAQDPDSTGRITGHPEPCPQALTDDSEPEHEQDSATFRGHGRR